MLKNVMATIIENIRIANGIYRLVLKSEQADLEHFVPGQFANIEIPGHNELLLKRPISINAVDADEHTVTMVYQTVGKGSRALAELEVGKELKTIMPVGSGFHLSSSDKKVFVVGGGVGIAPLLSVTNKWTDRNYEAFLGYRGKDFVYCLDEFKQVCDAVYVTSDDGTIGEKGFVTDVLKKRLSEIKPDVVLACGPAPMLRALKAVIEPLKIPAQVSMEERMGCGFGACAVCVCGIKHGDDLEYKKVCVEGPVFDLYEVEL